MSIAHLKLRYLLLLFAPVVLFNCNREQQWQGQAPITRVSTKTVPVQLQYRGTFELGDGIRISNEFDGARMNGAVRSNDTLITVLITPENAPINMSPWYAFKIWSESPAEIWVKLTYPADAGHRYYPKVSRDGFHWEPLDSLRYVESEAMLEGESLVPENFAMKLDIGHDTLWVSAQELITTAAINEWMEGLGSLPYVGMSTIGESREGRPIGILRAGESDVRKMLLVLSRQHPPEVTGFLAMQAFVEEVCGDSELAVEFRKQYTTWVIPVLNPDGVDQGHWRHNMGGVDLNRDWQDFNQPETSAAKAFMEQETGKGGTFYFCIDFHSTWEDIFYTISPEEKGNMPGLVPAMIEAMAEEFAGYQPNIRPRSAVDAPISSSPFFFYTFGAEALTYEVGDDTPRDFIRRKGEVTARKLMELMIR